ncbi:hypothetical protein RclHR1_18090003 [Rhizophagus clarus]|uniref:Uncharacterized protein n=1 Tax=Rhizophagus clarus TaxID=94130 RepID=A0A2Z6QLK3_9GLOM|nr:hypothetical protein RclHR1_18090003 [Rhizophagus clarus]
MGEALVKQIEVGIEKDKLCWQWMMYCAGDGNSCQRECGGIGKCIEGCPNEILPNNLKNYNDMHLYQLWLKNAQRYGKYCIGVDSKYDLNNDRAPILAVVAENNAGFGTPLAFGLSNKENNWTTSIVLKSLKNNIPCDNQNYQLWLKNAQRYGKYCIGVDSKYDLNNDRAPILAVVAENNAGFGTPLAFGLSNKENNWTTSIVLKSLKNNIPCDNQNCEHKWYYEDLPNKKGFQRITECAKNHNWVPLVMMDKHRPTKIATENVLDRTILCWFHIMKTFGENLNNWNIPWSLRYPIALAFKIVRRSRSVDLAKELSLLYINFINSLDLKLELKNKLIKDLHNNWICDEWILSFIDAGRILESTTHIMTTNNYTERLYGIKLLRENLTNECGQFSFEAGLAMVFDMQTIEQETQATHLHQISCANQKPSIYNGDVETAYLEIVNLYNIDGSAIFKSYSRPDENNRDPFQPVELDNHKSNIGLLQNHQQNQENQVEFLKILIEVHHSLKKKEAQKELERIFMMQSAQSSTQPTTMQSYWQNNYIHSFSPISQLT